MLGSWSVSWYPLFFPDLLPLQTFSAGTYSSKYPQSYLAHNRLTLSTANVYTLLVSYLLAIWTFQAPTFPVRCTVTIQKRNQNILLLSCSRHQKMLSYYTPGIPYIRCMTSLCSLHFHSLLQPPPKLLGIKTTSLLLGVCRKGRRGTESRGRTWNRKRQEKCQRGQGGGLCAGRAGEESGSSEKPRA